MFKVVFAAVCAMAAMLGSAADAKVRIFHFTAEQTSAIGIIPGKLSFQASQFQQISGDISYDSAAAVFISSPTVAKYLTGLITIDQFVPAGSPTGKPTTEVKHGVGDLFNIENDYALPGGGLGFVQIFLTDGAQSTLSGTSLPADLHLFPTQNILTATDLGGGSTTFRLTSLAAPGVPEPGVWSLMIAGYMIAGLAVRARRARLRVVAG